MRSVRYGNSDCSNEIRGTISRTEEKTERLNSLPESENYFQLNLSFLPPAMPHVNANSVGAAEGSVSDGRAESQHSARKTSHCRG